MISSGHFPWILSIFRWNKYFSLQCGTKRKKLLYKNIEWLLIKYCHSFAINCCYILHYRKEFCLQFSIWIARMIINTNINLDCQRFSTSQHENARVVLSFRRFVEIVVFNCSKSETVLSNASSAESRAGRPQIIR